MIQMISKKYAWYENCSDGRTHSGMQKAPNPLGLYDVYGNVSEWTQSTILDLPLKPGQKDYRVIRGGSYQDNKFSLRSAAHQTMYLPDSYGDFVGLRLVRDLLPAEIKELAD